MLLRGVALNIPARPDKNKTDKELETRATKEALAQAIEHYFLQANIERDGTLMDFYAMVWMPEAAQIIFRAWKTDSSISWLKYGF